MSVFDVAAPAGFDPEVGLLAATLDAGTYEWKDELGEVNEELLTRRPFDGGPSVGALLLHIAEVEAWWIEEILAGKPLTEAFLRRTLSEEIQQYAGRWPDAPPMPFADYLALLDEVRAGTLETLRAERDPVRVVPIPDHMRDVALGREGFTLRWIVAHVAQHEAYHGGQAVMVKRMLTGGVW